MNPQEASVMLRLETHVKAARERSDANIVLPMPAVPSLLGRLCSHVQALRGVSGVAASAR